MSQKTDPANRSSTIGMILIGLIFMLWLYYSGGGLLSPPQSEKQQASIPQTAPDPLPNLSIEPIPNGETPASEQTIQIETDIYRALIRSDGAVLQSLQLKDHLNQDRPIEMVQNGESSLYPFTVFLGDFKNGIPILTPSTAEQLSPHTYAFTSDFLIGGVPYRLEKIIQFGQKQYMIYIQVKFSSPSGATLPIDEGNIIYSLYYGPQIGPDIGPIGQNRTATDTRTYYYYNGSKVKTVSLKEGTPANQVSSSFLWAGIIGKYFSTIGVPGRNVAVEWSQEPVPGLGDDMPSSSQMIFKRLGSANRDSIVDDDYHYYIGPMLSETLKPFNAAEKNEFGLSDLSLDSTMSFSLAFLEVPIKILLSFLYSFTYNYGIAIILFALIVRIILFPLTLKSFQSTSKMQRLQPRLKELQTKWKGNPQKLQQEIAALYRKEKINPLGGCLPILLQMPILIAIANLFYRYFELRGAAFIKGWIDDLSRPDLIYNIELGVSLPLLGDNLPLRLLPVIYLCSQLLMSKLMQQNQPAMGNPIQKRIFTLYMPIIFSLILYNMPSGLILYWTVSNILIMIQQNFISKYSIHHPPKGNVKKIALRSKK